VAARFADWLFLSRRWPPFFWLGWIRDGRSQAQEGQMKAQKAPCAS